MKDINKHILSYAAKIYPLLVKIRRRIHMFPEPGFCEYETSAFIKKQLKEAGLKNIKACAKTGVVALLKGAKPGKTILLRADIDALKLKEETKLPYASKNDGFMHACGHDGHIACLIGAAHILNSLKDKLRGNVKFVFQPAEEGPGGAAPMIKEGALKNPKVDAAFALHIYPDVPSGKIGVKSGVVSAFSDEIEIKIIGKSGHAAYPSSGIDAIKAAADALCALREIVASLNNKPDPVVIAIGKITGGTKHNIIAADALLMGTVRTLNEKARFLAHKAIKDALKNITKKYGAKFEIKKNTGYPTTINDESLNKLIICAAGDIFGKRNITQIEEPSLGGEDFAYFSRRVPAVLVKLGGKVKGLNAPLHNNKFRFDEKILKIGAALEAKVAWQYLNGI